MNNQRPNELLLQPPTTWRKDFVRDFSAETLQEFERIRTRYLVASGEMLFTRGEPATRLFEIVSGAAKLWNDTPRQEVVMARLARAGEILGLREVVVGGNYGINATAATAMEVYSVPRKAFLDLLHKRFDAGFSATRLLSAELNSAHETLRAMVAAPNVGGGREHRHRQL